MHLVQRLILQRRKLSPRQLKCLRSHLESGGELGGDLEPHLQLFQGFCLVLVLFYHMVVGHYFSIVFCYMMLAANQPRLVGESAEIPKGGA